MNIAAAAKAAASYAGINAVPSGGAQPASINSDAISGFGSMVKDAIRDTVATGKMSEIKTGQMLTGKADVVDVVTAVAETEVAFETMVTLRDRMVAAYEEIMRMPV